MATVIKIKNTNIDKQPVDGNGDSVVATGELAYSYATGRESNNGDRLYIGTGTETSGLSASIAVVGGKYFTDMLNHVAGTNTASSAAIVDSNKKIDEWRVDHLQIGVIDGNTISVDQTSSANSDIKLIPGGSGDIQLTATQIETNGILVHTGNQTISGTLGVTGESTLASAIVSDLTDNRVVIAGTAGALEDDANFTFDGTNLKVGTTGTDKFTVAVASGNTDIAGTLTVNGVNITTNLDVTGQTELASLNVEDLTATRVVFAGADGELVDDANFTFNNTTDKLSITGSLEVDSINLDGSTITTTSGNLTIAPNANSLTDFNTTSAIKVPVGNTSQRPASAATGQVRYNTTTNQYEGYSNAAWQGLGGVIDVDQDTYVIAQVTSSLTVPGTAANTLYFVTGGNLEMELDSANGLTMNNLNLNGNTLSTTSGNLVLDPGNTGSGNPINDVIIYGNLNVMGTTTQVNSTTVTVDDPIFTLGGDTAPASDDNKDRGIEFRWHDGSSAKVGFFGYDDSASRFKFIADATNVSEVFSGSAAGAEFGNVLLDGITFSTSNYTANAIIATDGTGNAVFKEEDSTSPYGTEGQILQMNSSGVPVFGHIDCGTF